MDVRLSRGPLGLTVDIKDATTDQVERVLAHVRPYLDDPNTMPADHGQVVLVGQEPGGDGRAYVGQVIQPGTRFGDFPQGVRLARDGADPGDGMSVMQVSKDGRSYRWVDSLYSAFDPGDSDDRDNCPTILGSLVVKEVWDA